jgi:pilus assembly protein CpaB
VPLRRRLLTVVLAVLLALLGTGAVLAYVRQANNRALQGQKAVTVLVAQQVIPSGTSARQAEREGLLRGETLPAASVPLNAVTSITPARASLVTSAQVEAGQILLQPMLVTSAEATWGLAPPVGLVAVTIALCLPAAVGGGVHPGSRVEVFDTVVANSSGSLTAGAGCGASQQQGSVNARTRVALPNVQVLSVGPAGSGQPTSAPSGLTSGGSTTSTSGTATDGPASSQGTVLVTFAVTPAAAQRLIQLSVTGSLYLVLLRP